MDLFSLETGLYFHLETFLLSLKFYKVLLLQKQSSRSALQKNSQDNICAGVSFLMKLEALGFATLLKSDFSKSLVR